MPGHRDQRRSQPRPDLAAYWAVRGSDPVTARPPDRSPTMPPAWPAPARRGRTSRRRVRPVNRLLFRPMRRILVAYVRALVRAVMPWLLPLGILAALSRLTMFMGGH
jgi:hypothetical protein